MVIAVRNQFRDDETQRSYGIEIEHDRLAMTGQPDLGVRNRLQDLEAFTERREIVAKVYRPTQPGTKQMVINLRQGHDPACNSADTLFS